MSQSHHILPWSIERYAVTAMLDVELHSQTGQVPLADISERQGISFSYLILSNFSRVYLKTSLFLVFVGREGVTSLGEMQIRFLLLRSLQQLMNPLMLAVVRVIKKVAKIVAIA